MDVFRMASEIRKPYNPGQQSSSNEQVTFPSGATYPAADMEPF